jgi:hypothetical protein
MSSENASIEYESFATKVDFAALTDSGDHQKFRSSAEFWSAKEGQAPVVRPNGIITGGLITPSSDNDKVDVAGCKAYQAGLLKTVAASNALAVTRASTDTHRITSIIVNASGVIATVAGTEGTDFSEERGTSGGPPWIPTGAIELGQVRLSSKTAGLISVDEIKQGENVHKEMSSYPSYDIVYMEADGGILGAAGVNFKASLPLIHSDDAGTTKAAKKVYAQYYEPDFILIEESTGYSASERSYSLGSTQIYAGLRTNITSSMGQGGFTVYLKDGLSDSFLKAKDKTIMIKFYPDRNITGTYEVEVGKLGVKRTWSANGDVMAVCTLSPIQEGIEVYE